MYNRTFPRINHFLRVNIIYLLSMTTGDCQNVKVQQKEFPPQEEMYIATRRIVIYIVHFIWSSCYNSAEKINLIKIDSVFHIMCLYTTL